MVFDSLDFDVAFKNTVIILTSNLGADVILDGIDDSGNIKEEAKSIVNNMLKTAFRPEFLNRLDDIVFYKPLTKENVCDILDIMLDKLITRLDKKQLKLIVTNEAKEYIAKNGYDPLYGARPLKRFIQKTLENLIAKYILENNVTENSTLTITFDGEKLLVKE